MFAYVCVCVWRASLPNPPQGAPVTLHISSHERSTLMLLSVEAGCRTSTLPTPGGTGCGEKTVIGKGHVGSEARGCQCSRNQSFFFRSHCSESFILFVAVSSQSMIHQTRSILTQSTIRKDPPLCQSLYSSSLPLDPGKSPTLPLVDQQHSMLH